MSTDLTYDGSAVPVARMPGSLQAALVVTWVGAAGAAGLALFTAAFFLVLESKVWDEFGSGTDNPRFWIVAAALAVWVASALVALLAWQVHRGRRWAYWALLGLCPVAVLFGIVAVGFMIPPLVALFAVAVGILLLLPDSRAWARSSRTTDE
jgi:hypothetical protein